MGILRTNGYVVANGVDIAGAAITLPTLRLAQNQIVQSLGPEGLKGQCWHTHPSQVQAYEELGFQLQYVPLDGGKASKFDGLFQKMTIDGREIIANIHADQTRWDLVNVKSWGKVKWGNPPFWFKNRGGQTVFQGYDSSGNPQTIEKSFLVDAIQYYVDNPKALGSVTGNVPLVPGVPLAPQVEKLTRPLVVGLYASPERIVQIRENRLLGLKAHRDDDQYIDKTAVAEEVAYSRRLCSKNNWPSIDVTRRSIEETAAAVMRLLTERRRAPAR
ncbi:MAG: kinase/pyrophosphorylase [Acidobacteriia bacterium]|nr:kinase/pyrophosphorylase [Terriglobia bacterium]